MVAAGTTRSLGIEEESGNVAATAGASLAVNGTLCCEGLFSLSASSSFKQSTKQTVVHT